MDKYKRKINTTLIIQGATIKTRDICDWASENGPSGHTNFDMFVAS